MALIRDSGDVKNAEVAEILGQMDPRGGTAPVTPEQKRAAYRENVRRAGTPPAIAELDDIRIGDVRVRQYRPDANTGLTVLYLHGGGFVSGDLETHDPVCRQLATGVPAKVVAVDYRLAPENGYPAAVQDCLAVLKALQPDRVVVAGDSAGGNLAAVLALQARELQLPIAAQVLIYPMLDAALTSPSLVENGLIPPFTLLDCVHAWQMYLAPELDRRSPLISPLHAPELSGLAPALVITAEFDILRDEGMRYAERLRSAGVPVRHEHFEDMVHGFVQWTGEVSAARDAVDRVITFLQSV